MRFSAAPGTESSSAWRSGLCPRGRNGCRERGTVPKPGHAPRAGLSPLTRSGSGLKFRREPRFAPPRPASPCSAHACAVPPSTPRAGRCPPSCPARGAGRRRSTSRAGSRARLSSAADYLFLRDPVPALEHPSPDPDDVERRVVPRSERTTAYDDRDREAHIHDAHSEACHTRRLASPCSVIGVVSRFSRIEGRRFFSH